MGSIYINAERRAQLEEYAKRRGQDAEAALDEALANYLEWERQDFAQTIEAVHRGYEDVKAGKTRAAAEVLVGLRRKHELPR